VPIALADFGASPVDPRADYAELSADARPPFTAVDAPRDRDTAERLTGYGAEALVTGRGGDAIFFQMPTPAVAADLYRLRGWRAAFDPRALDHARWLRCSLWSLWRDAFRAAAPQASDSLRTFAGSVRPGDFAAAGHPWLAGLEEAPPGKRVQIAALIGSVGAGGPSRRGKVCDLIQPLLAQPMMELGLSIPSWTLVAGGRDRGLARAAFASWLPPAVVQRRSKGALTSLYARRIALGLPALREHLLDGVLVGAGLLDGAAIDRALDADDLIRQGDGLDLLRAAALESWIRHWQTRIPDAAQAARRHPPVRMV
jgi:asparagine synthase (glutamine-hydrolysing)